MTLDTPPHGAYIVPVEPNTAQIYTIKDEEGKVIYVGSAISAKARYQEHKTCKFRSKKTTLEVIDVVPEFTRYLAERFWIGEYSKQFDLINKQWNPNAGRKRFNISTNDERRTSISLPEIPIIPDRQGSRSYDGKADYRSNQEYTSQSSTKPMKLDPSLITLPKKKARGAKNIHFGPHGYKKLTTPNGREQYICTLPRCTHSLNIASWIVGKENQCESCGRAFIIGESKELKCEICNESRNELK